MRSRIGVVFCFWFCYLSSQDKDISIADSLYVLGKYSNAINAYSKVGNAKAEHQIARAYNAMGNYGKAILQYTSVIKKDTANILAQFELGKIYDKRKDYPKSRIVFEVLTEKSPDNPEFHYYLGKAHQELKEYRIGNSALVEAIRLDSTHLRSIYLLGKYYVGVEEPSNALEVVDLGLRSAPDDVALINLKALANFDLGNYEKAAPLFERLLELGEQKPFVYKKLGYSYANRWKYEEAKKAYRKLSEIINHEADAYLGLGQVFLQEKKLDSAEVCFLKSIEERQYIFDH